MTSALTIAQLAGLGEWTPGDLCETFDVTRGQLRRIVKRFGKPLAPRRSRGVGAGMRSKARRQPGTGMDFLPCGVCGGPVAQKPGKQAAGFHANCREFRKHQLAMRRHLREIEFQPTKDGRKAARKTRGDILADANFIPVNWHSLRGAGGQFRTRTLPRGE